jgi:hypothetical protein
MILTTSLSFTIVPNGLSNFDDTSADWMIRIQADDDEIAEQQSPESFEPGAPEDRDSIIRRESGRAQEHAHDCPSRKLSSAIHGPTKSYQPKAELANADTCSANEPN